ncbi:hypothetical protein CXG81DRAFT_14261 [Caulochytrium protostelioides]|uniref:Calcium-transporting ATPase n=1 Tax=Caulochytrium protostelioides TaxID=1555241 RepID=A0A4P9X3L6_9FUNG|nr:hypothetical protein CXG81DRAFT_14261 [Caulochytrium protostelioides]|eukprot:RKO99627.1 hypothetical protein CXG81DRAFT_14261 [Caulochytrium protostelioides]
MRQTPSAHYASLSISDVVAAQKTALESGLTSAEAANRLAILGYNELRSTSTESRFGKYINQFKDPLIGLLFGSAFVSLLVGEVEDAVSIVVTMLIVTTISFVQESRSEASLEALNHLVPHTCHLIRDGCRQTVPAALLVCGDLVEFSLGDRIPADVRLVVSVDLQIDESSLTGENAPQRKHVETVCKESRDLGLEERSNIAFMGTLVRAGRGQGIVVGTGQQTEFGHVFAMMNDVEARKTPLQHTMSELGAQLSMAAFGIILVISLIGFFQRRPALEIFTTAVSLAVAAIPEGLPIVVTVTLALGSLRMADRHAIVKKLYAVEGLSSVNVVCADKTGTLTCNHMTVTAILTTDTMQAQDVAHAHAPAGAGMTRLLMNAMVLCNNAFRSENGVVGGQATEAALVDLAHRFGLDDPRRRSPRLHEVPFDSLAKQMWVTAAGGAGGAEPPRALHIVKGALETLLHGPHACRYHLASVPNDPHTLMLAPITPDVEQTLRQRVRELASQGLRVLAAAVGTHHDTMTLVGVVGMADPLRPGIRATVQAMVKQSQIRFMMITGDDEETACSIAAQLGIALPNRDKAALARAMGMPRPASTRRSCYYGYEVEENLDALIDDLQICCRSTPRHKMMIVEALQKRGCVVAMTGDGVNDAPALRRADIGIAMGKTGTDVAKEAADMILVNDDLSTIMSAIEEGKGIFYNIQSFLRFQLSTSYVALMLTGITTFLTGMHPLNAMQILWINVICDGPVAQSLGVEPVHRDVMAAPPRPRDAPILHRALVRDVLIRGTVMLLTVLALFMSEYPSGAAADAMGAPGGAGKSARLTTMTFTAFVVADLFNALACRSRDRSVFRLATNKLFNIAVALCIGVQLCVIYVPALQRIFQTEALTAGDLVRITITQSPVLLLDELWKHYELWHRHRRGSGGHSSGHYAAVEAYHLQDMTHV